MPPIKPQPSSRDLPEPSYDYGHELRLQRLEEGHGQIFTQVAVLTQRVDTGFATIDAKIDSIIEPIHEVISQVQINGSYITRLKEKALSSKARWQAIQKVWWAVMIALASIAAKELGVYLYHLINNKI